MEQQVDVANDETVAAMEGDMSEGSNESPAVIKRTPRMLHESSFATSPFISSGGSRRPPGFAASSLDYKVTSEGDMDNDPKRSKLLNPKPSNRLSQQRQEEEQQQKQQQQQQQTKKKKYPLPTRAKGNFGPPPHQIASLEDLEHMTEDQLYRLFMEDPELYRSLLKSTGEGQGNSARDARKSNGNSRLHQSSERNKQARFEDNKEIPYFQWLVLLALMGLGLYQLRKSIMTDPVKQKRGSVASSAGGTTKGKGGKPKKQKSKKDKLPNESNMFGSEKAHEPSKSPEKRCQPNAAKNSAVPSVQNKKKKKSKKPDDAATKPVEDAASLVKITTIPETSEADTPVATTMGTSNNVTEYEVTEDEGDGEAWQTVAKFREAKSEGNGAKSKSSGNNSTVEALRKVESSSKPNGEPNWKETVVTVESTPVENQCIDIPSSENPVNIANNLKKKKKKSKQPKLSSTNKQIVAPELETASTEDDAALALQLQEEEETLAKNAVNNDQVLQEEEWEEVTTKKKRG